MRIKNIILGITYGHDGTAALLIDGHCVASVAEERISGKKYHIGFPYRAIELCLSIAGITPEEVHIVTVSFEEYMRGNPFFTSLVLDSNGSSIDIANEISLWDILREEWTAMRKGAPFSLLGPKVDEKYSQYNADALRKAIDSVGLTNAEIEIVEHHRCHAANAYYTSGWPECLIITNDGAGDGLCATVSIGCNGRIKRLYSTSDKYSIANVYSAVTKALGFRRHRHEGKITGLAAYGDPGRFRDLFDRLVNIDIEGRIFVSDYDHHYSRWQNLKWMLRLLTGNYFRNMATNFYLDIFHDLLDHGDGKDLAAAVQCQSEVLISKHVSALVKETGLKKVACSGGLFANVRINQKILETQGVEEVYIHPNMGDGGTAWGGALEVWQSQLASIGKKLRSQRINHVYLGPEYTNDQIEATVRKYSLKCIRSSNIAADTASLIASGKVVGRFSGRMEYGPRALGNRSILVNPRDVRINDWLNKRLHRTEFMPFAPSILPEAAKQYYVNYKRGEFPAEFMTITFDVLPEGKKVAPAVCHIDDTARPQVVRQDINPIYYKILENYKKLTGLPIFVNTSFNSHEHPIVMSPEDAIKSFLKGSVDVLSIGDFIVTLE